MRGGELDESQVSIRVTQPERYRTEGEEPPTPGGPKLGAGGLEEKATQSRED